MERNIRITVAGASLPNLKVAIGLQTEENENGPLTLLAINFYKDLSSFLHRMMDSRYSEEDTREEITVLFEDDVEEDEEEYDWETEDEDEDDFEDEAPADEEAAQELEYK